MFYRIYIKRALDLILATFLFVATLPLFIIFYFVILILEGKPVFYKGERIGMNEKVFYIYKFRSMIKNADKVGGSCTASDDCRLTPIGKIIRRYKIDELPQLFNMIKGDMSIIGPRPDTGAFIKLINKNDRDIILSVRPGLSDLATIMNIDEEELLRGKGNPENYYLKFIFPKKIELQKLYVKNISLALDIKILVYTIIGLVKKFIGVYKFNQIMI